MEMVSTESGRGLDSPKKPRGTCGVLCMALTHAGAFQSK